MSEELKPCPKYLESIFKYDQDTGVITWKVALSRATKIGSCAGSIDGKGRRRISINGKTYAAAVIAWVMAYGNWPDKQVDHINRDRLDNSIGNLRLATVNQNSWNRVSAGGKTKGVSFHRRQCKWVARIMANGVSMHLGSFGSKSSAINAYDSAARKLHGEFAFTNEDAVEAWNTRPDDHKEEVK